MTLSTLELVVASFTLDIFTHSKSISFIHSHLPFITALIKETNITVIQIPKTIMAGLKTFIKKDLKFICLVNHHRNENIHSHQIFSPDFPIHRNNTAIGDKIINIHKYNNLINANTQITTISMEYIIVVHHWMIVFKIVFLSQFLLELSTDGIIFVFII